MLLLKKKKNEVERWIGGWFGVSMYLWWVGSRNSNNGQIYGHLYSGRNWMITLWVPGGESLIVICR